LCRGVVLFAAQVSLQIDAATAEKGRFRMIKGQNQFQ